MKAIQDGPARPENPAQMPGEEIIAKNSEISSKSRVIHEEVSPPPGTGSAIMHFPFEIRLE
ncbi:MAG: hypothetical protein ACLQUW_16360 [Desulfobaccales bacterium]